MTKYLLLLIVMFCVFRVNGFQNLDHLNKTAIQFESRDEIRSLNDIGFTFYDQINYDSAIKYFARAVNFAGNQPYFKELGESYNALGICYYKLGNYRESIVNYEFAIDKFIKTKNEPAIAQAQTNIGLAYKGLNLYDKALEYLYASAIKLENLKAAKDLSSTYNAIGNIHREAGFMGDAYEYLSKSLKLRQQLEYSFGIAQSLQNLGIWHLENGDLSQAMLRFNKALELKEKLSNKRVLGSTLAKLGEVYLLMDSLDLAENYFHRSLENRKLYQNEAGEVTSFNHLAKLYLTKKDLIRAKQYADSSYFFGSKGDYLEEIATSLNIQKDIYSEQRNYEKALELSEELFVLNEAILDGEKMNAIFKLEEGFLLDKTNLELAKTQAEVDLLNGKNRFYLAMAIGLVVLLVISTLLLRATQNVSRERKKAKERVQRLLTELNHRTKNHLQAQSGLIRRQLIKLKDSPAKEVVKDIDNQIQAINLIHQSLRSSTEEAPESIDLTSYVTNIIENLMISFGLDHSQVNCRINLKKIDIDLHHALPIGLILNESVTNSFKYAFHNPRQRELKVELWKHEGMIKLDIADNGPGFDLDQVKSKASGLRIMKDLASDISGTLKIMSSEGTKVSLTFNCKK